MDERVKKLLENEDLMIALVECDSPEKLAKIFEVNSISLEEGLSIEDAYELLKKQADNELSEEALDEVSGGIALGLAITTAGLFVASAGFVIFLCGYAYQTYRNYKKKR